MALFSFWMMVAMIGLMGVAMIMWLIALFAHHDSGRQSNGVRD
jgi:hypothetical protein